MESSVYKPKTSFFKFLKPFTLSIGFIVVLGILSNFFSLLIPRFTAILIDQVGKIDTTFDWSSAIIIFLFVTLFIFIFAILQTIFGTIVSERITKILRLRIIAKISEESYEFVNQVTPSKLLTNLTSDVESVKQFIAEGFPTIISAIFLAAGATIGVLSIDISLSWIIFIPIPLIAIIFGIVFLRITKLFDQVQKVFDKLNAKITESISASLLIRVLNAKDFELEKFARINHEFKETSANILKSFSLLIPTINLIFNLMIVAIIYFAGLKVISNELTLGELSAFYQYASLLIAPIFILGFVSGIAAKGSASYKRIAQVLESPRKNNNKITEFIPGKTIQIEKISHQFGDKVVLKNISFQILPKTKNAILGPTGGGKTVLLNILTGLIEPTSGLIYYGETPVQKINTSSLYSNMGIVFGESIIFNSTIKENITLGDNYSDQEIMQIVEICALGDLVTKVQDLQRTIAERGATLSGGQKQRLTLARALIKTPNILILDDFTSRVDINTEQKIFQNINKYFPDITIISVTQKVEPIKNYDQIILIMESELVDKGSHTELIDRSLEYRQIFESQESI